MKEVPLAPLREAFAGSGLTFCEVARRINRHESFVRRYLGGRIHYSPDGSRRVLATTNYENACALAEAIGVDPFEVGL